jgi:hypothetical protein
VAGLLIWLRTFLRGESSAKCGSSSPSTMELHTITTRMKRSNHTHSTSFSAHRRMRVGRNIMRSTSDWNTMPSSGGAERVASLASADSPPPSGA